MRDRQPKLMPGCTPYWATLHDLTLALFADSSTKDAEETFDLRTAADVQKVENTSLLLAFEGKETVSLEFDDNYQRNDWFYLVDCMRADPDKSEDNIQSLMRLRLAQHKLASSHGIKCREFDVKNILSTSGDPKAHAYFIGNDKKVHIY